MKDSVNSSCRNFSKKKDNPSKKWVYFNWTLLGLILFAGLGYATTINEGGVFNAGQLTFGNTTGSGVLSIHRPLSSNYDTNLTVCSSGCQYTTIQDAVNQVPLILKHQYQIQLTGTYNEDVYVPPVILSRKDVSDGSIIGLYIIGNQSDTYGKGARVRSFQVSGATGAEAVWIKHIEVFGQDPASDENVSVSIYGSNSVSLSSMNFTGNVVNAVMGYSSAVNVEDSYFNNQSFGLYIKLGIMGQFGDDSGGSNNKGTIGSAIAKVDNGYININSGNQVIAPNNASCPTQNSSGFITYKGEFNCMSPRTAQLSIFEASNPSVNLGKAGTNTGGLQLFSSSSGQPSMTYIGFASTGIALINTASGVNKTLALDNSGNGEFSFNITEGEFISNRNRGAGNALACLDSTGRLYRGNTTGCP